MWVKTYNGNLVNLDRFDIVEIRERDSGFSLTAVREQWTVDLWASVDKRYCVDAQDFIKGGLSKKKGIVDLRRWVSGRSLADTYKVVEDVD